MNDTNFETLWDSHRAAEYLGMSRSWLYHRVEAGLIPHLRIGNTVRFEPQVLRDFARRARLSSTTVLRRLSQQGSV